MIGVIITILVRFVIAWPLFYLIFFRGFDWLNESREEKCRRMLKGYITFTIVSVVLKVAVQQWAMLIAGLACDLVMIAWLIYFSKPRPPRKKRERKVKEKSPSTIAVKVHGTQIPNPV